MLSSVERHDSNFEAVVSFDADMKKGQNAAENSCDGRPTFRRGGQLIACSDKVDLAPQNPPKGAHNA